MRNSRSFATGDGKAFGACVALHVLIEDQRCFLAFNCDDAPILSGTIDGSVSFKIERLVRADCNPSVQCTIHGKRIAALAIRQSDHTYINRCSIVDGCRIPCPCDTYPLCLSRKGGIFSGSSPQHLQALHLH